MQELFLVLVFLTLVPLVVVLWIVCWMIIKDFIEK